MNSPDDPITRVRTFPMRRLQRRLRTRPRFDGQSFNRILPNLLTMTGLCMGLTAMRFAVDGRFGPAAIAIIVAAIIDGLDGRLALLLKATSRFGAEFDSLSDFLCFGVAPAFVLFLWSLHPYKGFGFAPCVIFAVCMALRLARFNAALDGAPKPAYAYNFFTGVPAPAGAGVVLFPLFLGLEAQSMEWDWLLNLSRSPVLCAAMLIGTATLSISTLPVWSFKNFKIPTQYVLPLLIGAVLFLTLLLADPWLAMAAGGLIYLGMLPFSARSYMQLKKAAERTHAGDIAEQPGGQTSA